MAIKQLGSNGGGFFNVNSAHPFENPTQLSNLSSSYLTVLLAFALAIAFGVLVKDKRQGRLVLWIMVILWVAGSVFAASPRPMAIPASPRPASTRRSPSTRAAATWKARKSAPACRRRLCGVPRSH